mmetsp:Transcript_13628/g.42082  ORF Transcript_13628/g.42082 Transcript_13628/m.42082 type:complete len:662 (+) Transcript_13628:1645-3630(+)
MREVRSSALRLMIIRAIGLNQMSTLRAWRPYRRGPVERYGNRRRTAALVVFNSAEAERRRRAAAAKAEEEKRKRGTIEDLGCFTGGPRLNHGSAALGWKYHSNDEIARCFQDRFLPELQRNGGVGYFGIECGGEIFWCFEKDRHRLSEGGRHRKGDHGYHHTGRNHQNIRIPGFSGAINHIGGDGELQIHKVTLGGSGQACHGGKEHYSRAAKKLEDAQKLDQFAHHMQTVQTVGLFNRATGRWVRVTDHGGADSPAIGGFNQGWMWERFEMHNVGHGQIGLYNYKTDRWLRVNDHGGADSPAKGQAFNQGWQWERFVVRHNRDGTVGLHNPATNRWLRVTDQGGVDSPAMGHWQHQWQWERFELRPVPPLRTVQDVRGQANEAAHEAQREADRGLDAVGGGVPTANATLEYMGLWRDDWGRTFPPMPSPLPGCKPQEGGKFYWSRDVAASVQQLVDRIAREGHTVGYLALQYPCGEGVAVFESVGPAEHFRRVGAGGSAGRSTRVRVPGVVGVIEAQGGGLTNAVYKITLSGSPARGRGAAHVFQGKWKPIWVEHWGHPGGRDSRTHETWFADGTGTWQTQGWSGTFAKAEPIAGEKGAYLVTLGPGDYAGSQIKRLTLDDNTCHWPEPNEYFTRVEAVPQGTGGEVWESPPDSCACSIQ